VRVERDIADPGGFTCWFYMGFSLGLMIKYRCAGVLSKNNLMILYLINSVILFYIISPDKDQHMSILS